MFETLVRKLEKGVYKIFPSSFEDYELLDSMAPSILIGIFEDDYIVVFDPRSTIFGINFQTTENEEIKKFFSNILSEDVKVSYSDSYTKESLIEDINFYQEMGTIVVEDSTKKLSENEVKKLADRYKIFSMIALKAKQDKYTMEEKMLSISPGMAGLSMFVTLDTKFMIWLKNETELEGEKFKFGLLRIFNAIVATIARKFGYERMSMLPYESLLILNRDVEKVEKLLNTIDIVNKKLREHLPVEFPKLIENIRKSIIYEMGDIFKSADTFFEYIAALPDERAYNHFKEKLISTMDSFAKSLEDISVSAKKWIEDILEEVQE